MNPIAFDPGSHANATLTSSAQTAARQVTASQLTLPLGEYLFRRLIDLGVAHVFGVPGDYSLPLLDNLHLLPELKWVGCASELGAAYAADGYARARGLGVVCTTFGVGELGALSGLAGASAEDVGVLHLVGAPASALISEGAIVHHTLADGDFARFGRIAQEVTDAQLLVTNKCTQADIDVALSTWSQRRRPVYIQVPRDLERLPITVRPMGQDGGAPAASNPANPAARALIADFFAEYPAASGLAGHLAVRWNVSDVLSSLGERGVTIATLPNSTSAINASTPGYVGIYCGRLSDEAVRAAVESHAGLVEMGCTFADTTTGGLSHSIPKNSTLKVGLDLIEWSGRRVPLAFAESMSLLSQLWPTNPQPSTPPYEPRIPARESRANDVPLTQAALWETISLLIPRASRVFAETGTSFFGATEIALAADCALEVSPIWGAIGYALPAAIGAAMGDPSRRVFCILGDGAAQVTSQELGLLARAGVNPVFILLNNGGYTIERIVHDGASELSDIPQWDWAIIPRAFGVSDTTLHNVLARSSHEFERHLTNAIADTRRAQLIEAVLPPQDATPSLLVIGGMLRKKHNRTSRPQSHPRIPLERNDP